MITKALTKALLGLIQVLVFSLPQHVWSVPEFTGPNPCSSNPSITGYSDMRTLSQDMNYEAFQVLKNNFTQREEYVYVLCPGGVFNAASSNPMDFSLALVPALDNTTIMCGGGAGSCTIDGGPIQVLFYPDFLFSNVTVKGIRFSGCYGVSVGAWANSHSTAAFEDCHFESNFGTAVVEVWYDPGAGGRTRNLIQSSSGSSTSIVDTLYKDILQNHPMRELVSIVQKKNHRGLPPSSSHEDANRRTQGYAAMAVDFHESSFEKNQVDAVVSSSGGILEFYKTNFLSNEASYFIIGALFGTHLLLHTNCTFRDNQSNHFLIFVDSDSFLQINEQNTGERNYAEVCDHGILLENEGSYCLIGGNCHGECCEFGNSECDLFDGVLTGEPVDTSMLRTGVTEDNTLKNPEPSPVAAASTFQDPSASHQDGFSCGSGCVAFAVILPLIILGLVMALVKFYKKAKDGTVPANVGGGASGYSTMIFFGAQGNQEQPEESDEDSDGIVDENKNKKEVELT